MPAIEVTCFSDPGCPWAYSAAPAHAVLHWRYGDQLRWKLVTIGLAEDPQRYVDAGYTPVRSAQGYVSFRRYGMPFAAEPKARVTATSRACRAIVATRLLDPAREQSVFRALQLGWFTTSMLMDEDPSIATALGSVEGLDVDAIVGAIEDPKVIEAYEQDKEQTRQAEGSPTELQGKARQTDGPVRYSAPSLVFLALEGARSGQRLEAGGFQTIEAYDVLVANLDPTLKREPPPEGPLPALRHFPDGLVTQEVAAIMTHNNQQPDRVAAEQALIALVGSGEAMRTPLGDDALWQAT